jgi:hypothetical protein
VKVHDRDDVDAGGLDPVQETVRELWKEKTPELAAKWRAGGRGLRESLVRVLNGRDELEAQAFRFVLVELRAAETNSSCASG